MSIESAQIARPEVSPAAREHARHRLDGTPGNLRCLCGGPQVFAFVDEWQWHEHVVVAVTAALRACAINDEAAEAVLDRVRASIAKANALRPEDFKTGQDHLSLAFREINFRDAFTALAEILNQIESDVSTPPGVEGGEPS